MNQFERPGLQPDEPEESFEQRELAFHVERQQRVESLRKTRENINKRFGKGIEVPREDHH